MGTVKFALTCLLIWALVIYSLTSILHQSITIHKQKVIHSTLASHVSGMMDPEPDPEKWMANMENKYGRINNKIKEVCQKSLEKFHRYQSGKSLQKSIYREYMTNMYDRKHGLAYCWVAKIGTSTWLKHFLRLSPKANLITENVDSDQLHRTVPKMFKFGKTEIDELYGAINSGATSAIHSFSRGRGVLNFSFVRHPFDRLVSFYTDKVLGMASSGAISAKAYAKFHGINFTQFIDHVLHDASKCNTSITTNPFCDSTDLHWRPQYMRCQYCDIHYDVIGKMETFGEDVKYIVIKQNLTHLIPVEATDLKFHASSGQESKTIKYFRQLSKGQIEHLYQFYSPDFELFDFDISKYLVL